MNKYFIWVAALCGALAGLFMSLSDDFGTQFILAAIGAVGGIAVGGAIAGIGAKGRVKTFPYDALADFGTPPENLLRNYWRDQWRPPYAPSLRPEDGRYQFDADKMW